MIYFYYNFKRGFDDSAEADLLIYLSSFWCFYCCFHLIYIVVVGSFVNERFLSSEAHVILI